MQDNISDRSASDFDNTCMLVSDSREVGSQMDSKKLPYGTLTRLAEDNLFRKHLDMSKYLTRNQYGVYSGMLEDRRTLVEQLKAELPSNISGLQPKFRVVDGQVILLEASSVPAGKQPQEYVREHWNVTTDYQLLPIPNSMLRGMLEASPEQQETGVDIVAQNPGNERVYLTNDNIPPHMHHSAVTTGRGFTTMHGENPSSANPVYSTKGNVAYDMFYDDQMDVGIDRNELDGTLDRFEVSPSGKNESTQGAARISHDNMPLYHAFYGFVVRKIAG